MFSDFNVIFNKIGYSNKNFSQIFFVKINSLPIFSLFYSTFFSDLSGIFKKNLTVYSLYRTSYLYKPFLIQSPVFLGASIVSNTNTNWVYREFNEFFGQVFLSINDQRNLLLDYKNRSYPLHKSYPCTGFQEINFCLSSLDVAWSEANYVEL